MDGLGPSWAGTAGWPGSREIRSSGWHPGPILAEVATDGAILLAWRWLGSWGQCVWSSESVGRATLGGAAMVDNRYHLARPGLPLSPAVPNAPALAGAFRPARPFRLYY